MLLFSLFSGMFFSPNQMAVMNSLPPAPEADEVGSGLLEVGELASAEIGAGVMVDE